MWACEIAGHIKCIKAVILHGVNFVKSQYEVYAKMCSSLARAAVGILLNLSTHLAINICLSNSRRFCLKS